MLTKLIDSAALRASSRDGFSSRGFALGRVIAGTLLLWILLEVGGRLGPVHWLHILPEYEASRHPGRWSTFESNLSIRYENWTGETALSMNLPQTEFRGPIQFSSDELGFRKTPGFDRSRGADYVIWEGASLAYGGSLSDEETLAAALTRRGLNTYNAGHPWWIPLKVDSLDALLDQLGKGKRDVIAICWETANFFPDRPGASPWYERAAERAIGPSYASARSSLRFLYNSADASLRISPVSILSIRAFKLLGNGVILPNPYLPNGKEEVLPNGQRILFSDVEVEHVEHPAPPPVLRRNVEYFVQLAQHLSRRGLRLHVILLPNRYSVYGPLIDRDLAAHPSDYLERMERELTGHEIGVLNLKRMMQANAADDVASGHLAYFREDHHWNPKGVERVADAFRDYLGTTRPARERGSHAIQ